MLITAVLRETNETKMLLFSKTDHNMRLHFIFMKNPQRKLKFQNFPMFKIIWLSIFINFNSLIEKIPTRSNINVSWL